MLKFLNIETRLSKLLANDPDPINMVRAKFLVHAVIACLCICFFTIPNFYLVGKTVLFYRSVIIFFLLIGLLNLLLRTAKWKVGAHIASIMLTMLIWSNIFFVIKGVNILSIQFTLLLIVLSYYLLGSRWGVIYAALTVLPMLLYFSLKGQSHIFMSVRPTEADSLTFSVLFLFNFALIIYLQYHFFNSFNITIKQLHEKQREEKLLNKKLQEAIVLAEESSKAKSHFLSTISHELRTPLNGVIGMSDILLINNPREDQTENLNILKFSAHNLLHLINNVLDFSKIESGKLEIESIPFNLDQLVQNIYKGFKANAEEKGLAFQVKIDPQLKTLLLIGDPTRLTQVLINLIDNALKFTERGEVTVWIAMRSLNEKSTHIDFRVQDTGIGIDLEKQEMVFESFTQSAADITRKYGGTGLGLAIVKNLLMLMDSAISINSAPGQGTTFAFDIAFAIQAQSAKDEAHTAQGEPMELSTLRILIAEDNEMNTLLMKKLLATWGIVPDFASNGAEAVAAIEQADYDLVLMDIHMPVMDGYEAAAAIRQLKQAHKANVPITALTAASAWEVNSRLTAVGIDDMMMKPFNSALLRAKLESLMLKKQFRQNGDA